MANALTALRLVLAVPVAWGLSNPGALPRGALLGCVLVAIASDFLDGVVARRTGTATSGGMLFDHTTDFLFVTSALGAASMAGVVPRALPVLIVFAFSQYVADSYWLLRQKQLRMSRLGRWNGILYFVPIVILGVADIQPQAAFLTVLVSWTAWGLTVSTVASMVDRGLAPFRAMEDTLRTGADGEVRSSEPVQEDDR